MPPYWHVASLEQLGKAAEVAEMLSDNVPKINTVERGLK